MQSIPAVVVGTSFGGRVHVPALRAAGFDVVALVGRDPARTTARAAELGVPQGFTDLDAALETVTGPFLVTVSTPPFGHVEPVVRALEAGAHVLCEKPFALDADQAARMTGAAEAAGTVALVGCEFRWSADEALARRLIEDGAVGTPQFASFIQHSSLVAYGLPKAFNADWWFDRARGGGILNAAGVHAIDRFRTWFGEPADVTGRLSHVSALSQDGAEDTYTATLSFESGCVATLQHCAAVQGPGLRACRVVGDKGTLWLEDGSVWLASAGSIHEMGLPDDLAPPAAPSASSDPKEVFTTLELPPYTRLAERLRDLIQGERVPVGAPPTPTFADALRTQRVVDAIRESDRRAGATVTPAR